MRLLVLSIVLVVACSRAPARGDDRGGMPTAPSDGSRPTGGGGAGGPSVPAVPTAKVFLDGSTGTSTVTVEVVRSPGLVQRGLMYRKYLAPDAGMLFLMDEEDDHYFWMKNCFIALDIIFIGKDLKVAGILYDMQPGDTNSKGVGKPSVYVLEVNSGWAKQHGVVAGTPVRFEGAEEAAR